MKKGIKRFGLKVVFLFITIFLVAACSSSKNKYRRAYAKVWKELIQSQAWKESLAADKSEEAPSNLYTSTEETLILKEPGTFKSIESAWFIDRYASLVSRAYFKIIAEAENADTRLQQDYEYWTAKSEATKTKDKELKKKLEIVNKKYEAHKNMLLGLKSWNIFSEDRSGDLDYFKAENEEAIYKMYLQGLEEKKMINYLVFQLADLYHFED
ncbi:hypothetical protein [uncultured Maribacter sp.]|uniref:hypothetical protein n=1 Tax=uncultured Maribacter sp. TaxID=431308 RepID=UPI002635A12D|nr:hypothetical protein [uncultured Maribacter sp.]